MVSEMQTAVTIELSEVWVPEFGLFDTMYLEQDKQYQGRLYRLSAEATKAISEIVGFTAKFDSPSIRTAYLDIVKTEGHVTLDMDRNTKPTDLSLRYSRELWGSPEPISTGADKGTEALRPWMKSVFETRFVPEKVFGALSHHLRLKPEQLEHFYIRVNFKDKTAGLISEDQYIEEFPTQPFQVFALPAGHIAAIPATELSITSPGSARSATVDAARAPSQEAGAKYATYSKSEIDRMLKLQTENITSALGSKIGSQQRVFQDAVEAQEKAFVKIADKLAVQVEDSRGKLEISSKSAQESMRAELEQFKNVLSKELNEFRAHVNKNILPVSKAIEEKVQAIQVSAKQGGEDSKPILLAVGAALLAAIIGSTVFLAMSLVKLSEISEIKVELSKVADRLNK